MKENTPDWLIDIQNKSWEPEILISGITLTFLFILTNYIFNFYGMLIQELNVPVIVGRNLYVVSTIILTGLKVGLVIHLILRGIWTGFVGLSYVFPEGVNKQNLPEKKRSIDFHRPEIFVVKLERVCSLLFSFIFSSIIFVGSFCLGMIPFAILYMVGLDISIIRAIIIYVIVPFYLVIGILLFVLATLKKTKRIIHEKIETSIFGNMLAIFFTNIGTKKTRLLFLLYFIIISLMSLPDILRFDFYNNRSKEIYIESGIVQLNQDSYKNQRNEELRIAKAAIDKFWVTENTIQLFISFYREDLYTIQNLNYNLSSLSKFNFNIDSLDISIQSIYQLSIDDKVFSNLRCYSANNKFTDQKGIIFKVPLDSLNSGYHELKINKIYWINPNKEVKLLKNWDIIPFEIQ